MIVLDEICKNFNSHKVLSNLSFSVKTGEIVGLLGPNAAGKTTTLRLITGVLPPSSGSITIDNLTYSDYDKQLKQRIGYLPENNPLPDDVTVEEYLHFWADIKGISKADLPSALDFVITHTHIHEVFYRPISELSKGFKQRVGLSQAILTQPDILILDEPTEGLDPNQRQEIAHLIKSLGKKRTVIISSHVLSEIAIICNRIIIINNGVLVADDTPDNLRQSKTGSHLIEAEIIGSQVISSLKKIAGVINVTKINPNCYSIEIKKGIDARAQIYKLSVSQKWILLTMFQKQQALEDVFAQLTTS